MRVAVIDSGALASHPDLKHALNTDLSKNFTGDGGTFEPIISDHGTHVSGIIAADGSNENGVIGTAPGTDLVELRVFTGPFATFGDIVAAMVHSADIESDVANMSLGSYPLPDDSDTELLQESVERASSYANEKGTLLVAAAGKRRRESRPRRRRHQPPERGRQRHEHQRHRPHRVSLGRRKAENGRNGRERAPPRARLAPRPSSLPAGTPPLPKTDVRTGLLHQLRCGSHRRERARREPRPRMRPPTRTHSTTWC